MDEASAFYGSATVGAAGQIILPRKAREAMGIARGDQVIVVRGPRPRSITLFRGDSIQELLDQADQSEASAAA